MEEKLILVYYIGTGLVKEDQVGDYVTKVMSKITSQSESVGEILVIPTKDIDTRIECINPKYITEPELIREHRLKMDVLHENLQHITTDKKKDEPK